jgi:acyl-CoA thioester hydrolase
MRELFKHKSSVPIRFADVDAFGHVNNAKYLTYFEEARINYFNDIVDWAYNWEKEGVILARAEVDFIMPVHFRDDITIWTRCPRIGTKSFDLHYRMIRFIDDKEILMADCVTVMVAFDYNTKESVPVPEEWRKAILSYERL